MCYHKQGIHESAQYVYSVLGKLWGTKCSLINLAKFSEFTDVQRHSNLACRRTPCPYYLELGPISINPTIGIGVGKCTKYSQLISLLTDIPLSRYPESIAHHSKPISEFMEEYYSEVSCLCYTIVYCRWHTKRITKCLRRAPENVFFSTLLLSLSEIDSLLC